MPRSLAAALAALLLLAPVAASAQESTSIATLMQSVAKGVAGGAEAEVGKEVMGWTLTSLGLVPDPNAEIVAALDQIETTLLAMEAELADIEEILEEQSCQNAANVAAIQNALNAIDVWVGRGTAPPPNSYLGLANDAQNGVDVTSRMASLFDAALNGNAEFPPLQDLLVGLDNALRDQGNAEQLISACGLLIDAPSGGMDDRAYFEQLDGVVGFYAEYQARAVLLLAEAYHWRALQAWLAAGNDPASLQPEQVPLICNGATGDVLTYCVQAKDAFDNVRTNLRAQYGEAGAPYSTGKPTDSSATFDWDPNEPVVQMQNDTGFAWVLDIDDFFAKGGYSTSCQESTSKSPCGPGVDFSDVHTFAKYGSSALLEYGGNGGYTTWRPAPAKAWENLTESWSGSSTTLGQLLTDTWRFADSARRSRVYFTGNIDSTGHHVSQAEGSKGSGDVWHFEAVQVACFVATPMTRGNSTQPFCSSGIDNLMHGARDHEDSKNPCYNVKDTEYDTLNDAEIRSPFFQFLYNMQTWTCKSSDHPDPRKFYQQPPGWLIEYETWRNEKGLDDTGVRRVSVQQQQYHWPAIDGNAATCTVEPATGLLRSRYALNGRTTVPRLCGADFDAWFEKWVAPPAELQSPPRITAAGPVVVTVPPGSTAPLAPHAVTAVVDYAERVEALDPEDGPLPVSCFPAPGASFQLGTTEVRCQATDTAGATGEATFRVSVQYPFRLLGRLDPEHPTRAHAGRAIRVAFDLGGDRGPDAIAGGRPTSVEVDCESGAELGAPAPVESRRDPRYDAGEGLYELAWKTEKGWAGQCRDLVIALADGTSHRARVRFHGR